MATATGTGSFVHDVECPSCGRVWTGEFEPPLPDKSVCRDCIRKEWGLGKDHKHVKRTDCPEFR
jgi:hypothetical protein